MPYIKAYHQREERYQGLLLEYGGSTELKSRILEAIGSISIVTGLSPMMSQNDDAAIYIEFHDEYDRDGGMFFTDVLAKLGIADCESA